MATRPKEKEIIKALAAKLGKHGMPTVHFLGRVFPAAFRVSVQDIPPVKWEQPEVGLQMEFQLHIKDSAVDVECVVNRFSRDDLASIWTRAFDLARAAVDLVSFSRGWGLLVVFETFVDPNGASSQWATSDASLPPLCTSFGPGDASGGNFSKLIVILLQEPSLFMALNDLIAANTFPHCCPTNCGRVLDSIRNMVTPPTANASVKQSWEALRTNLRAEREYLQLVTDLSTGPRHGDRTHIPGPLTTEILKRTWIIMDRFLEFRKRGSQPLPESEFPVLAP